MAVASVITLLPIALDGDSVNNGNVGLAVISLLSIVLGYLLLAALWYFVFSERSRAKRRDKDSSD